MLRKIRYFLRTAETGSFSLAAKDEYVTPQALAKQITLLEEELGGKLFYRSPKGAELTPLGQFARQKYSYIEQMLDEATQAVKDYAQNNRELLRVGIFSALPKDDVIYPLMAYFLTSCPSYQVNLEMIELEESRKKMMEGKLDLLLTNVHEEDDIRGFSAFSFAEYETKVVVSVRHPWCEKETVTEEDLREQPFIKMQVRDEHYKIAPENSFYHSVPCKKVIPAKNFETMMVLLQQAAGFALFPMNFSNMEAAKVKAFDYPGRKLMSYTSLLVSNENREGRLRNLVDDLIREFSLKEL